MSRSADVAILTLCALDEVRLSGAIKSPPLVNDEVRRAASEMRAQGIVPTKQEVQRFLRSLMVSWHLNPNEIDCYVETAMQVIRERRAPGRCELLDYLMESPAFVTWLEIEGGYQSAVRNGTERHHIFGGKTRDNVPSNLLRISSLVHFWCHNVAPVEGRIACIWRRSKLPEFRWADLDECAGFSVQGWLWSHEVSAEPFCSMRRELLSL